MSRPRVLVPPPRPAGLAVLTLLAVLAALPARGADGDPDPTFSADGIAVAAWQLGDTSFAEATAAVAQEDGGVVVGGTGYYTLPSVLGADVLLARFTAAGIPDAGWGDNGRLRIAFDLATDGFDVLLGLFPEAGGKVMVLLSAVTSDGERPAMVRLLANGDPDPAFGVGGFLWLDDVPWPAATLTLVAAARQPDGKYLFAGHCGACLTNTTHLNLLVVRVLADGTPDTTWSFDGWASIGTADGFSERASAIAADPAGGVVVGLFRDGIPFLVRLAANGGVDSAFGDFGWVQPPAMDSSWTITDLAVVPGTREVVASSYGLSPPSGAVFRLTGAGDFDVAFGDSGYRFFDLEEGVQLRALERQGDGRLVVGGTINATGAQLGGFFLGRLDAAGDLDSSFDANGVARYEVDRMINGDDDGLGLVLAAGRPLLVGRTQDAVDDTAFAVLRVENAYLFADGFEAATTGAWPGH